MAETLIHSVRLVTAADGGMVDRSDAWVRLRDGVVADVGSGLSWRGRVGAGAVVVDAATQVGAGALLTAGLVDIHCHGGGGVSFDGSVADIARAVDVHRRHGVTGIVLSLVSAPMERLEAQVARAVEAMAEVPGVLGVHLEGPFLAPDRRGAHDPAALQEPDAEGLGRLLATGAVRQVTLAPERAGGMAAVAQIVRAGAAAAVGHTDADADTAGEAFSLGATVLTHAFNGMRGLHHRAPGPVGAAVADERVTLEVIPDGVHVDGRVIRMLFAAARDRIAVVSDAMAAAGAADGRYQLGTLTVQVRDGAARVAGTGSLAGSTLTLDEAVRRCVRFGIAVPDAVRAATSTPARAIGRPDLGVLAPGSVADVVLWDAELTVERVWQAGEPQPE
jgi:N-acetylglucosamine-6-phosphate deacetylase